jgi:hypothetical protein
LQSGHDVLHPALASPVAFGWKVDHIERVVASVEIIDEHLTRLQFLPVAHCPVAFEIIRKDLFELESQSPPHDPDTVHGVDQGLGIGSKDITPCFSSIMSYLFRGQ